MTITTVALDMLKRPALNVRHHPQKQIDEMMRSLEMFGQTRPMVVDEDYVVLVGNGMLTAMERLGWQSAECYVKAGLSAADKKKLMLADNRVYDLGLTDMDAFDAILKELDGDIDISGWDEALLKTLTSTAREVDELISGYGSFETREVDALNRKQRDDYVSPSTPEAAYSPVATPNTAVPDEPNDISDERRYIVCPKCGERICL